MPKVKYSRMGNNTRDELREERREKNYKDLYKGHKHSEDYESKFFNSSTEPWWKGLSSEQRHSIEAYTGSKYEEINEYLRKGKMGSGENPYIENIVTNADNGLKQFKLKNNQVLYRKSGEALFKALKNLPTLGYGEESMRAWAAAMNGYKGSIVHDKGFTSTSTRRDVWSGKVWMEIMAPKGTNGAYVGYHSLHPSEREFILNRGTRFQIVSARVEKQYDGMYHPVVVLQIIK